MSGVSGELEEANQKFDIYQVVERKTGGERGKSIDVRSEVNSGASEIRDSRNDIRDVCAEECASQAPRTLSLKRAAAHTGG